MNTFLLTWNPAKWPWPELQEAIRHTAVGRPYVDHWSTGNTKRIAHADRVFLLKQGKPPRGIMAAGEVTSDGAYELPHYVPERAAQGDTSHRVDVKFERILEPTREQMLSVEEIGAGPLSEVYWRKPASGIELPDEAARELESLWARHLEHIDGPDGSPGGEVDKSSAGGTETAVQPVFGHDGSGARPSRIWLLQAFGQDRSYAGNTGYDDDVERVYKYDSFVQNHRQVREGDLALLRSRDHLIGCARIERIGDSAGLKERLRCPVCGETNFTNRKTLSPAHRCVRGHEFDTPAREMEECRKYEAFYGGTFRRSDRTVAISVLRASCPRKNRQLAIQEIDLQLLRDNAPDVATALSELMQSLGAPAYPAAADGAVEPALAAGAAYVPSDGDARQLAFRQIRERRGQATFREALRQRYGDRCLISGCELLDVLEAAHIRPYRGKNDNHPDNGLLLR